MIIPYSTEVEITRWPFSNLAIMAGCVGVFVLLLGGYVSPSVIEAMILTGWNPIGLVGHQFVHAGFGHILFNMLFLWVFGNAVCEKVGNGVYGAAFLLAGIAAAALHNIMDGAPAVGASGAINGIVGLYLVLYPINRITCFFWFFRPGTFDVSGFWLILFWFVVDAWQAFSGAETGIAYWGHVGGFVLGVGLGFLFLATGVARMASYDNPTLLDYLSKRKTRGASVTERGSAARPGALAGVAERIVPRPAPRRDVVPFAAQPYLNVDCPHCLQNLDVPTSMIGHTFACASCGKEIELQEE